MKKTFLSTWESNEIQYNGGLFDYYMGTFMSTSIEVTISTMVKYSAYKIKITTICYEVHIDSKFSYDTKLRMSSDFIMLRYFLCMYSSQ